MTVGSATKLPQLQRSQWRICKESEANSKVHSNVAAISDHRGDDTDIIYLVLWWGGHIVSSERYTVKNEERELTIPMIAPAHPITNAVNAAIPKGSFCRSFHALQSYGLPRRKIRSSSSMMVNQITIQYPIRGRKFSKMTNREPRPPSAQAV